MLILAMVTRVTEYYKSISHLNGPLLKQYEPDELEDCCKSYETVDPLHEESYMVVPRLIHRYKDRVLLLVTDNCLMYCRHCFRRDFVKNDNGDILDSEIEAACDYIKSNSDIHEVLLSGGDPLSLPHERVDYILTKLKNCRDNLIIRIGTRVPVVDPGSITPKYVKALSKHKPVWIAIQCNHPDELTKEVQEATGRLIDAGINIVNQSVLLKGVNDSVTILRDLCHKLLDFRIKPYYIFQGDLARGTSHFRVPLKDGLKIIRDLRSQVSGLAMPTYAVDIPGGGGKIPLTADYIVGEDETYYYLKNNEGFIGRYPKE